MASAEHQKKLAYLRSKIDPVFQPLLESLVKNRPENVSSFVIETLGGTSITHEQLSLLLALTRGDSQRAAELLQGGVALSSAAVDALLAPESDVLSSQWAQIVRASARGSPVVQSLAGRDARLAAVSSAVLLPPLLVPGRWRDALTALQSGKLAVNSMVVDWLLAAAGGLAGDLPPGDLQPGGPEAEGNCPWGLLVEDAECAALAKVLALKDHRLEAHGRFQQVKRQGAKAATTPLPNGDVQWNPDQRSPKAGSFAARVVEEEPLNQGNGSYCRLHLIVHARTELGQSIRVSGFFSGGNNAQGYKAISLVTTPGEYPMWRTSKPIMLPYGGSHTYHFAIFNGGKFENREGVMDRTVNLLAENMIVEDEYGVTKETQRERRLSGVDLPMNLSANELSIDASNSIDECTIRGPLKTGGMTRSKTSIRLEVLSAKDLASGATDMQKVVHGRTLVFACFHLPIELKRDVSGSCSWEAQWNDSLISRSDNSVAGEMDTVWIGTVNAGRDRVLTEADKISIRKVLEPMNCVPIFAAQDLVDRAYFGFCKDHLWPSFHNVDLLDLTHSCWRNSKAFVWNPELAWDASGVEGQWRAYEQLNKMFAQTTVEILANRERCPNGAVLWVHDYHLMLLPKLVTDEETRGGLLPRKTKILFFFHLPFSTAAVFQRTPRGGDELLAGIMQSDGVGFHSFGESRHFVIACKRHLGLKFQTRAGGMMGIEFEGRAVSVLVRPVSIETAKLDRKTLSCNAPQEAENIRAAHPGRKIIVGLDTCQRLSGVVFKLLGLKALLDEHSEWRGKVVLYQRCFKPRNRLDDEERTSAELRVLVERINAKHPGSVDYAEIDGSRLTSGKRLGMWRAGDVYLNTSVKGGHFLEPFEYVYVRKEPGVMILSEFTVVATNLNGAIRVNPHNVKSLTNALTEALVMRPLERRARKQRDIEYVTSRPSSLWCRQMLGDLFEGLSGDPNSVLFTEGDMAANMGEARPLEAKALAAAYRKAKRRVLVFDYGGTLRQGERVSKYMKDDINPCKKGEDLPPSLVNSLRLLAEDPANSVYVVSGLTKASMAEPFEALPRVGLAAQNGLCWSAGIFNQPESRFGGNRMPSMAGTMHTTTSPSQRASPLRKGSSGSGRWSSDGSEGAEPGGGEREWFVPDFGIDWEVVNAIALPVLNRYTGRTNGSSIRFREPTMAWSYYRADPEWGFMQAEKLVEELTPMLGPFGVRLQRESGEVEIMPTKCNKASFISRVLRISTELHGGLPPDLVFVVGDDASDERMFGAALGFVASVAPRPILGQDGAYVNSLSSSGLDPGSSPVKEWVTEKVSVVKEPLSPLSPLSPMSKLLTAVSEVGDSGAAVQEEACVQVGSPTALPAKIFNCTVGKKATLAGFYVDDVPSVEKLLGDLVSEL